MEETVKQRLEFFIKEQGLSVRGFEKACGVSTNYLRSLRHTPSPEKLAAIFTAYPQLSRTWLLTGEGDMITGSCEGGVVEPATGGAPFYGEMPVSAGRAGFPDGPERPTGTISIPGVSAIAYFPVLGCSMLPLIRPGDIVGVARAPSWERIDPDSIYLIITVDGERMIKHILPAPDDQPDVTLRSENFPDFRLPKALIAAVYKVVFCGRLL